MAKRKSTFFTKKAFIDEHQNEHQMNAFYRCLSLEKVDTFGDQSCFSLCFENPKLQLPSFRRRRREGGRLSPNPVPTGSGWVNLHRSPSYLRTLPPLPPFNAISKSFKTLTKRHQTPSKRLRKEYKRHRKKIYEGKMRSFLNIKWTPEILFLS